MQKYLLVVNLKFDTSSFGASGHYTRRFSSKSHSRIAGKIGRASFGNLNFIAAAGKNESGKRHGKTWKELHAAQVKEARIAAERAQQLLENVANRKRKKQSETGGLVITNGLYGNSTVLKRNDRRETNDDVASQVLEVTLPLNFLVSDSGELKLHEGVKKSGIMGFCDPCPGDPKSLHVDYTYGGNRYEVDVDDYKALHLPNEDHRI